MLPTSFATYMEPIWNLLILILTAVAFMEWRSVDGRELLRSRNSNYYWLICFSVVTALYLGLRPVYIGLMGDSWAYFCYYTHLELLWNSLAERFRAEKLWVWMMLRCKSMMDVSGFFIIVALGYVMFALFAFRRLQRNNVYGGMLFFFGALSFFSYGTNGIRSGLAGSIVLTVFALLLNRPKEKKWRVINAILAAELSLAAYTIHNTVLIPLVCFVVAYFLRKTFVMRNTYWVIGFWLLCLVLLFGTYPLIDAFIWHANPDIALFKRLKAFVFLTDTTSMGGSFFRPDFLVYSFMPILLWWFVKHKVGEVDDTYTVLINTYILANALWVLVMWIYPSNRIAYLSWFMYPLVLAYPCLRMNVWKKRQGDYAGAILMAHTGFTVFMDFIYYGV